MEMIVRLIIYASSVFISSKYASGYWIVGPVFGMAVVCWDSSNLKSFSAVKHLAFLAASTLVYALVFHLSRQNWNRGSDFFESLVGPLSIAVVTGSVLLPAAHQLFLRSSPKAFVRTVPLLIASYYLVTFISLANDTWQLGWNINFLLVAIGAWQGVYLYSFFLKK